MKAITKRILTFNEGRLPDILPFKYAAMSRNPFSFFRGSCHIFYEDLKKSGHRFPSPKGWLCGDLHLENFGSYKGNNRLVYFDLNDFDEALLAPVSFELLRLVTSIFVAFASLRIEKKKASNLASLFLKEYACVLASGKATYIEPQTAKGIVKKFLGIVSSRKQKDLLKQKTERHHGKLSILSDHPKHYKLEKRLAAELCTHIRKWVDSSNESPYHYKVVDVMFRLAGTSSLGLKRYVFLLKSTLDKEDYLLLEMKQASPSQAARFISARQPHWRGDAERVVAVQERVQNVPPALASATTFRGESFIIQEMQPVSDSINFKFLKEQYRDMCQVIMDMGKLTASGQLRSAGRQGADIPDKLMAFGKRQNWQAPILAYAESYAETVVKDFLVFKKDVSTLQHKEKHRSGAA